MADFEGEVSKFEMIWTCKKKRWRVCQRHWNEMVKIYAEDMAEKVKMNNGRKGEGRTFKKRHISRRGLLLHGLMD